MQKSKNLEKTKKNKKKQKTNIPEVWRWGLQARVLEYCFFLVLLFFLVFSRFFWFLHFYFYKSSGILVLLVLLFFWFSRGFFDFCIFYFYKSSGILVLLVLLFFLVFSRFFWFLHVLHLQDLCNIFGFLWKVWFFGFHEVLVILCS